jgi:hypothetical protein
MYLAGHNPRRRIGAVDAQYAGLALAGQKNSDLSPFISTTGSSIWDFLVNAFTGKLTPGQSQYIAQNPPVYLGPNAPVGNPAMADQITNELETQDLPGLAALDQSSTPAGLDMTALFVLIAIVGGIVLIDSFRK